MTDFERGKAYSEFAKTELSSKESSKEQHKGFTEASNELGIPLTNIHKYASFYEGVLNEKKEVQEAVKQNKIGRADFEAIEKYLDQLQQLQRPTEFWVSRKEKGTGWWS